MRVSLVNCVSTAAKMMRFSDESLFRNAWHFDFDYIVVKWLASPEVNDYLNALFYESKRLPFVKVHVIEHQTNNSVGYVPNLRSMMNEGFSRAFQLNEYAGLVNTDCYFGPGWLSGLVKYAAPNRVINGLHITKTTPVYPLRGIVTEDLGVPEPETFNIHRFDELYLKHYHDNLILASEINGQGGYRQVATMPYLFHRKYWESCGPWELTLDKGTPDVRFFDRIAATGAEYALTESCIVYHHEATERRGTRPTGAEHLCEE